MTLSQLADDDVQLSLLATSGHAGLAAELLTERFGLSPDYANSVLDQGYGLLIARLGRPDKQVQITFRQASALQPAGWALACPDAAWRRWPE